MVVAGTERVDGGDDLVLDIGYDAHFTQVDADRGQVLGDVADVLVLGPARENLVADHQDRRGHDPPWCIALRRHVARLQLFFSRPLVTTLASRISPCFSVREGSSTTWPAGWAVMLIGKGRIAP